MKFLLLIVRNTMRNRRRTVLTIASIGMSLFLISTLKTLVDELENPAPPPDAARRLIVRHQSGLGSDLPVAHRDRIRRVAGVEHVIAAQWFGGVYKDPGNFFAQFAVDAKKFFDVMGEVRAETPEQEQAFIQRRTGALAGVQLAERFGWEIGDRVTLEGTFIHANPELTIVGFVRGGASNDCLYFHWDYINQLDPRNRVGTFWARVTDIDRIPGISEEIDALFRNTANPTRTETEAAFTVGLVSMWGNVRLLVMSISTVVLFTVILVAANTMAMSIRERTGEIAVLRAIGFRRRQILWMMIAESSLIGLLGAAVGAVGGRYVYRALDLNALSRGFIQTFDVQWSTILLCAAISIAVAFFSTLVPAYHAANLPIAVAVRRRGE